MMLDKVQNANDEAFDRLIGFVRAGNSCAVRRSYGDANKMMVYAQFYFNYMKNAAGSIRMPSWRQPDVLLLKAVEKGDCEMIRALESIRLGPRCPNPPIIPSRHANCHASDELALQGAALHNQLEALLTLIELQADVQTISRIHFSPMLVAAATGNIEVLETLLRHKANIDYQLQTGESLVGMCGAVDGDSALHVVARFGNQDVVGTLLRQKCEVQACNSDGHTWQYLLTAAVAWKSVVSGDVTTMDEKLAKAPELASHEYSWSDFSTGTLLEVASWEGHLHMVQSLLAAKADLNHTINAPTVFSPYCGDVAPFSRMNALILAAGRGHAHIVRLLLQQLANPDSGTANNTEESCLQHAPLHFACQQDNPSVVKELVSMKADVNMHVKLPSYLERHLAAFERMTSAHIAAAAGCVSVLLMLAELKADLNAKTKQGHPPAYFAACNGQLRAFQTLRSLGCPAIPMGSTSETPLAIAAKVLEEQSELKDHPKSSVPYRYVSRFWLRQARHPYVDVGPVLALGPALVFGHDLDEDDDKVAAMQRAWFDDCKLCLQELVGFEVRLRGMVRFWNNGVVGHVESVSWQGTGGAVPVFSLRTRTGSLISDITLSQMDVVSAGVSSLPKISASLPTDPKVLSNSAAASPQVLNGKVTKCDEQQIVIMALTKAGLESFTDTFMQNGYDTWDVLLCLGKEDFDCLGLKRGHQKKLMLALEELSRILCANVACRRFSQHDHKFPKCPQCKVVRYCSSACQEKDWPRHKQSCNILSASNGH